MEPRHGAAGASRVRGDHRVHRFGDGAGAVAGRTYGHLHSRRVVVPDLERADLREDPAERRGRQTNDNPRPKLGPVFQRGSITRGLHDGSLERREPIVGDTWTVPVAGGTRRECSPTRPDCRGSMPGVVSELQPGSTLHMGLVTATANRREARQIYLPAHERGMAHFPYPSPDRAWLLVVEMGPMGTFNQCRLLPFDGSSTGRQVAGRRVPVRGVVCQSAVDVPSRVRRWTARHGCGASAFPTACPSRSWTGADPKSRASRSRPTGVRCVTSIGVRQSSLWLRAGSSERLLSSEGYASQPMLSRDGARLYYLQRQAATSGVVELRVMDLATQKSDRVLPDFSVVDYVVSRDEQLVAFTTRAADRSLEIWVAALNRAPRRGAWCRVAITSPLARRGTSCFARSKGISIS